MKSTTSLLRHAQNPVGPRPPQFPGRSLKVLLPRAMAVAAVSAGLMGGGAPGASALVPVANQPVPVDRLVQTGTEAPSRYIVRYVPGTDVSAARQLLQGVGITVERDFSQAVVAAVVSLTPTQVPVVKALPVVEAVEVDGVMQTTQTQQPAPWGLDRLDQRALPLSGSYTTMTSGAGVNAYVVDTGVLGSHAEFGGRVAQGWSAITDGRGSGDCNGHGTHVAGTIAGKTYGVAKATTIIPVRVFSCSGSGSMSNVIAGLDWVAGHHAAGTPAVVNLSLGGSANSTVDAALQGVINDGVTAVVSAGNSSTDACTASPARLGAALTIAASDSADRQASFSNTGSCVDLHAPGVAIMSASYTSTTATATMSGTSMAAPHSAGAAALLLSKQPSMTPAQVTNALTTAATTGVMTSPSPNTPNKLLFTNAPTTAPAPAPAAKAPAAPTNVRAAAQNSAASLTWTRGQDGGSPMTGQTVTVFSGTQKLSTTPVAATASATTITGLTAGKSYSFTVTATNKIGSSPASLRSNTVTPTAAKVPAAPTAVKATAGSRSANLSWTRGSDNGSPLTGQTITAYSGTQRIGTVTITGTATTVRITGLTAGKSYSFTVTATNKIGSSAASARSSTVTALA